MTVAETTGVLVKTHLNDENRGMTVPIAGVIADLVNIAEKGVIVMITTNAGAIAEIDDSLMAALRAATVIHLYTDLLSTPDDVISVMEAIATCIVES